MNPDLDTLARTLYGEAKANDAADALAIACVIRNRVVHTQWPDTYEGVCQQPWQFSCWNANDPNRARILAAVPGDKWFDGCVEIARKVIQNKPSDPTGRATHYYAKAMKRGPTWAKGKTPCYDTAGHFFFNDIDTPAPTTAKEALDQARPLAQTRTVSGARNALIGGGVLAAAAQAADTVSPLMGVVTTLAQYAPWVLAAALVAGIGYMVWARIDDRNKGLR